MFFCVTPITFDTQVKLITWNKINNYHLLPLHLSKNNLKVNNSSSIPYVTLSK